MRFEEDIVEKWYNIKGFLTMKNFLFVSRHKTAVRGEEK